MIQQNNTALSQALVAQIQSCAANNTRVQDYAKARTAGERAAVLAEITTAEYMHNHSEIVRIFQAQTETQFVPYEA